MTRFAETGAAIVHATHGDPFPRMIWPTNGSKLARLFNLAGEKGIPVIGMNDSAGAFVPAGVGGLDGYAEAFTALRKISGVVPSIMCMFGFNAGGGSYLPRQGSFVIQPSDTFFGLTGPGVVKSVLGEDITPEELGGPKVHGKSGVADLTVGDEVAALRTAVRLLSYIPDNNYTMAPYQETSDPLDRKTWGINTLLKKAFNSPTGFNTPFDVSIIIQQICDHGDYFELQPDRAREAVTAFGRLLHEAWTAKRQLASGISNSVTDQLYERAIQAGALGGKISGAGGGGFFLLCVPSDKRQAVRHALRDLREMPFRLERGGTKVILNMQRYS